MERAQPRVQPQPPAETLATVVLGGGCFWCTEAVFQALRGVTEVIPGYVGGTVDHPTYAQICEGDTGHAEVVRITYDPAVIGLDVILAVFFATHDPTTLNRQGNDVGTQYRSVIFWADAAQRQAAEAAIAEVTREGWYDAPLVTELAPLPTFWPAEPEHHDFYARNPWQGYCQWVITPKLAKLRQHYAAWLA